MKLKFVLIAWPIEKNGPLFSIINRKDLIDSYGLLKGQLRYIVVNETFPFTRVKTYSVKVLAVGSLLHCQEQFVHWKCERQNKSRKSGRVTSIIFNNPISIVSAHNHQPDPMRQECLVTIDKVKDMSLKADSNPRMIMKKAQESLSLDAAAQMTRHVNLRLN